MPEQMVTSPWKLFRKPGLLVTTAILGSSLLAIGFSALWPNANDESQLNPPPFRIKGSLEALSSLADARYYGMDPDKSSGKFYDAYLKASAMGSSSSKTIGITPRWRPMGPTNWGGRTLALAIDPVNPDRMYAGSASGGLWVSDSAGRGENAWRRVATGYPVLGVASIALDPADNRTLLIGTGEVYSYRTGFPSVGERIVRGSFGIGILKSTDGGVNWYPSLDWRYDNRTGVQDIEFDPQNSNIVWAATTEGIYKSSDRGESWQLSLDVRMATSIVIHPDDTDRLIVACGGQSSAGNGLYRTTNGGMVWTRKSGLPFIGGKALLSMCASAPQVVYATFGCHPYEEYYSGRTWSQLLKTENFGLTWRTVNTTDFARYQGFYSHFPAVHPEHPDYVIVGGVELYLSTNGGSDLAMIIPNENSHWSDTWGDNHALVFHPHDPGIWYVACDQGIFRLEADGTYFERCVGGYQTAQFYNGSAQSRHNRNMLFGSIQDWYGKAYSGGTSWETDLNIFEGGWNAIHPDDDELRYHSAYYLNLVRYDHGQISDITPPEAGRTGFSAPFVMSPSNPEILYGGRDVVYRSDDRGDSWLDRSGGHSVNPNGNAILTMAISHYNENRVYASTAPRTTYEPQFRTGMFRTANGGRFWENITHNLPDRFIMDIAVDPEDDDRVYLALGGFGTAHLFATTDGGDTWNDLDRGNLPDAPAMAVAIDPHDSNRIFVGNDLGVFVSTDNGETWFSMNQGLPPAVMVMDLLVYENARILRAATHGNGFYEIPIPVPGVSHSLIMPRIKHEPGNTSESVALVNPGPGANVRFIACNGSGEMAGISDVIQWQQNHQHAFQADGLLHLEGYFTGWAAAEIDQPDLFGLYMSQSAVEGRLQNIDGAGLLEATATDSIVPRMKMTGEYKSELSLVNPGATDVEVSITGYDGTNIYPGGTLSVPAQGSILKDPTQIFGVKNAFDGCLRVQSTAGIMGNMTITNGLDSLSSLNTVPVSEAGERLYAAHIVYDDEGYSTELNLVNPGGMENIVTVSPFFADGSAISSPFQVTIPAGQLVILRDAQLGLLPGSLTEGWLMVESSPGQPILGSITFSDPVHNRFESTLPLQKGRSGDIYFPQVANGDVGGIRYFTGVALINTADVPLEATLSIHFSDGRRNGNAVFRTLQPGEKYVRLLSSIEETGDLAFQSSGYLHLTANGPVCAYQLFGNEEGDFLSAVPGQYRQTAQRE